CFSVADWTVFIVFDLSLPAPTFCLDYRLLSGLSPLLCLPVINSACPTTSLSINMSQMDPTPPEQSLTAQQKTSPPLDPATAQATPSASPATVHQITTELSAQASTLMAHQHQLDRLTDLTGQLVQALQGLQLTPPATPPPAAPPAITPASGAQAFAASPRLAFPEKFDGSPAKSKGFLLQCSLFVSQQPHLYPTDEAKIAFVCSLLSGRALDWATAVWRLDQPTFPSFQAFLQRFKEVFQPSSENGEAGEQIMALKQGRRTAADYALTFRTLAAQSGWNDGPLKLHYRKGLNAELQVELACRDEGLPLEQYIELSIRVDNIMRARKPGRPFTAMSPPMSPPAPEPMQIGAAMNTYIQEELAKGFIRPSTSPASAGFFFVKKKDGGLRPCIDYRALNELTIKYRYPLPLVPSALEQLRSAKIFTKLDLRSAYNLIRIRSGDEWKTAFSTTSGHYEYLVMPFGLANSPSCFQAFVNEVFRDMLNRWVIVYIDDILIYSSSYSEHVTHVRAVLQRLISHQLYAKEEKCEFHLDKVSFLGYIISPEGVAMDERKVNAVLNWPRPTTLKELQRFLGFSNFYRHFIRNFSSVAAPLTAMVKRGASRLTWSQSALQAFDELRRRFTTAPVLHHPDPDSPFVVEVDASSTGRQGEPAKMFLCAFFSHKLSPAEKNYDVGNRELLAIKLALEEWRHWLEGAKHPFTVLTDHKNLEYLRSAKLLNHRQARWALFFSRFNFSVTYRPGSQNTKADALSRLHEPEPQVDNPEPILPPSMILAPVTWDLMTEITEAQVQDPTPAECPPNLVYVPLALRPRVLTEVHHTPSSGHPGIEATMQLLGNRFWWPGQRTDTIQFINKCATCNISKVPRRLPAGLLQPLPVPQCPWSHIAPGQRTDTIQFINKCATCNISKVPRRLPAGLLQPLPVPQCPWSHIAVDFVTYLPPSSGYTTILSVIDRFSKACRFIPLTKLPTAMETAELLCNWVFRLYGLPEDIVSDRGPQFSSRLWSSFFSLLGVNVSLTSGYHPQANGQAERLNQELTHFLRTYCHNQQNTWSRYLFWAEYAQNSLRKPSTQLTPFQCILGFQPPLFPWSGEPSNLPAVNSWFQQSEETWNQAHVHLQSAIRRTRAQADLRRRPNPSYEPGQWVWLSTRDLRLRLPSRKLSPRYVGPFQIIRQITPVSFRLRLPSEYRISPTFHVSLLKPADSPEGREILDETASQGAPPIIIDGEEVYQVRAILDSRRRRGHLQYLVDWVPATDILDPSLTADFHSSHPDRPAPRGRGRPRRRPPPRARSRSQGGGSVTTAVSVAPSNR
ncbi:hypothetical protein M9458_029766, partial [Cirrhinus mrigala]